MRTTARYTQEIIVAARASVTDSAGDVLPAYAQGASIHGTVSPVNDGASAQMYGEKATDMRRILAQGTISAARGDGVWLDGYERGSQSPPWTVKSVKTYRTVSEILIERTDA